ncbi:MAG: PID-CTERM protein-sorting domain-containing protein [Janthinobacterium lividum]
MKNTTFLCLALATAGLWLATGIGARVLAQAPGTTGPTPQATPVPLDGGALLLLAAGVGLGLKRLRQRRAQQPK